MRTYNVKESHFFYISVLQYKENQKIFTLKMSWTPTASVPCRA